MVLILEIPTGISSYRYFVPTGRARLRAAVINGRNHLRGRGYERGSCGNSAGDL